MITAPGKLVRSLADVCPYGIQFNVSATRGPVRFIVDYHGSETTVPNVSVKAVLSPVVVIVRNKDGSHCGGKATRIINPRKNMEVSMHEYVIVYEYSLIGKKSKKDASELSEIVCILKQHHFVVAASYQMQHCGWR